MPNPKDYSFVRTVPSITIKARIKIDVDLKHFLLKHLTFPSIQYLTLLRPLNSKELVIFKHKKSPERLSYQVL